MVERQFACHLAVLSLVAKVKQDIVRPEKQIRGPDVARPLECHGRLSLLEVTLDKIDVRVPCPGFRADRPAMAGLGFAAVSRFAGELSLRRSGEGLRKSQPMKVALPGPRNWTVRGGRHSAGWPSSPGLSTTKRMFSKDRPAEHQQAWSGRRRT